MADTALSIRGLTKIYGNQHQALKGIDLDVADGDFFALLGPNGAGKSTTLGIVSSMVNKTSGKVTIFGIDIDQDFSKAKYALGVVPQEFNFNPFETVENIVLAQAGFYGISRRKALPRARQLLHDLGLGDKLSQQARTLSGGMKRRLMIARALIHQPRLLILDEPTAGVDIELRRSMWEYLQRINEEEGTTIILTTHYLEEAEALCRNIAIIDHGDIIKHSSMQGLLSELDVESLILDVKDPLTTLPDIPGFSVEKMESEYQMAIAIKRGQHINDAFSALTAQGIEVLSMRNRSNRLEELFVSLIEKKQSSGGIR